MTSTQISIIRNTWQEMEGMGEEAMSSLFYGRLFTIAPEVKNMSFFRGKARRDTLLSRLQDMVDRVDLPTTGRRCFRAGHRQYGEAGRVNPYAVGNALLWMLGQKLGEGWNDEIEDAWIAFYSQISDRVMRGQSETLLA